MAVKLFILVLEGAAGKCLIVAKDCMVSEIVGYGIGIQML